MEKKEVKVFMFDTWGQQELEDKLNEIVNDGYRIQDSTLQLINFYQSTVSGVYVFTLAEEYE